MVTLTTFINFRNVALVKYCKPTDGRAYNLLHILAVKGLHLHNAQKLLTNYKY